MGHNCTFSFKFMFQTILCLLFYKIPDGSAYNYVTEFFEVPLDHFSFTSNTTFTIKYLYNDTFWKKPEGPIFFYTGNEGDIESFANNTGFMWEIAEEFGAILVFGEHRFYGESFPENFTYTYPDNSIIGYLTVEQVLADYAKLLTFLKKSFLADSSPVISFGGSYGVQLTAYLRMKYPHVIQGGIAASAPLFFTDAGCELHDKVLKQVFSIDHPKCVESIRKSWNAINHITSTDEGKEWLSKAWRLCQPIEVADNVTTLKSWLQTMYSDLGMVNYPYPATFLRDLPAYPVKTFCEKLAATNILGLGRIETDENLLTKLFDGINMYYNHTGQTDCFDYTNTEDTSGIGFSEMDAQSFDFQTCTELIDPVCDDGLQDFFEPETWDVKGFISECEMEFGVKPQFDKMDLLYGGKNILAASNIVFSNGVLDPWHPFGVLQNLSDSLLAIVIEDAAHHLDLRAANPMDPPSVLAAREFEKRVIRKWIQEYHEDQAKIRELLP